MQYLWVASDQRGTGLGQEVLTEAETEARQRGCRAFRLDTFSFQAPGCYEKLGYQEFGRLDDFPPGHSRHFRWKPLNAGRWKPLNAGRWKPLNAGRGGQQSGASAGAG